MVAIMRYDYEAHENKLVAEASLRDIATSLTDEEFAELISSRCNGNGSLSAGRAYGEVWKQDHRALQNNIVETFYAALKALGEQRWTDERNENAVRICGEIGQIDYFHRRADPLSVVSEALRVAATQLYLEKRVKPRREAKFLERLAEIVFCGINSKDPVASVARAAQLILDAAHIEL